VKRGRWSILAALLLLVVSAGAAAQVPLDSVINPDSLNIDTVNTTERYLKAQEALNVRLPALPRAGFDGPLPAGSRIILDRDSLDWALAETVSDLLQRVPGVYLWRGGWLGRTEYPNYRGRGPGSVEYYIDGLPYVPIGPDSVGVDPSFFSLSLYDRIEIEQWPGQLRIKLFTNRHQSKAPGSRVGIASGDKEIARYNGALEYRFTNGIGLSLGGERMVAPTATGLASDYDITNVWVQLGWVPSARFGIQAQFLGSNPDRKAFVGDAGDTLETRLTGKRSDQQLRAYWGTRADGLGLRFDGYLARTTWKGGGIDDEMRQGGVVAAWRTPRFGISARAFNRSRVTPIDLQAEAGWNPIGPFSIAGEVGYQTHDDDRESRWVGARAGLQLPLGLSFSGSARKGEIVTTPALLQQPSQDLTDWQVGGAWNLSWFGVEAGYGSTDRFQATPYRGFTAVVDSFRVAPQTEWLTVGWRLSPRKWLTFQGWYSNPRDGNSPDGVPQTHSMTTATIRSKFWRTFKSGIFDFKAQLGFETWGDGTMGLADGSTVRLDGASFMRTMIEIRLDQFLLYWDRYNLQSSRKTYVPGFTQPILGSTFGVKWVFVN
jgi:hypothetical protein